ncbi:hypothetical protein QM012_003570 [Aureobasidium pullulans]|uniref:Calpain catalytic domain-containing protein n=1 Tax=Aureobasidium pullulans TaxID=5580 RepID=A0ABR0TA37_AURPU
MDAHTLARALEKHTRRPSSSGTTTPDRIMPFPIRLIHEEPSQRTLSVVPNTVKPRNDDFYRFWDRFLATSSKHAPNTSALGRRLEQTLKDASGEDNDIHTQESTAASYEQATKECLEKVDAIVSECTRLNQKYRDRHFEVELAQHDCIVPLVDEEGNSKAIQPSVVKRVKDIFENPTFNAEGACGDDVMQGSIGNCWLIAALVSVAAKPGLMQRLCVARDEAVGVYGFVFFRDGIWIPEIVDDRLFIHVSDGDDLFVGKYVDERQMRSTFNNSNDITKLRETLQKGGEALYFATWLPLIEKAYAKAHGDYGSLHGGWVGEGTEDLTGGVSTSLVPSDILDKSLLWKQLMQVNDTYLIAGGAFHYREAGGFGKHAYAVLQAVEHKDLRLLKIRNPWGNNKNPDQIDGPFNHKFEDATLSLSSSLSSTSKILVFWVTFDNFLRYFDSIQRTRLFDETWTVTQQWTSVEVPAGAAIYLDTSFQITLSHSGPVVFVLAQPDISYFQGLQGRYTYCLHFRVYSSSDETKFLARSMHVCSGNYTNTRSVSVDLDLEAGSYDVLIKIEPTRTPYRTAESVIDSEAPYRKQKLLQIGRNFELAHAKGKLREREVEVRKQKKAQAREKACDKQAKSRKRRHETKARDKKRKDRIAQEKKARETGYLLKRAGYVPVPPPPNNFDPPGLPESQKGRVTGCLDIFDDDPNAELDDDDFEWDSEMDGDIDPSSSEDETDLYAEDPWNALLVLGLRVYSQASGVTIKIKDGNETDDEQAMPSTSTAETDGMSESKPGEPEQKLEGTQDRVQPEDSKTTTREDVAKQESTSSEAALTRDAEDKSSSNTADASTSTPSSDPMPSSTSCTTKTMLEQKD